VTATTRQPPRPVPLYYSDFASKPAWYAPFWVLPCFAFFSIADRTSKDSILDVEAAPWSDSTSIGFGPAASSGVFAATEPEESVHSRVADKFNRRPDAHRPALPDATSMRCPLWLKSGDVRLTSQSRHAGPLWWRALLQCLHGLAIEFGVHGLQIVLRRVAKRARSKTVRSTPRSYCTKYYGWLFNQASTSLRTISLARP
jgi:hypothetical protein